MLWFPLLPVDNDLFYHLSGGRYLASTGAIHADSFFSFLEPPRPFVNYYWLFQSLVFKLFEGGGYEALLGLRALVFALTLVLVLRLLWARVKEGASPLFLSAAFSLVVLMLVGRMSNLRPHVFSYCLIALSLCLVESKLPFAVFVLPVVAALWANLHGVEYPVLLLILGAYFLETLLAAARERSWSSERLLRLAALGLSPLALLLSPHGTRLLAVPFRAAGLASTYINELDHLILDDLTTVILTRYGMPGSTVFFALLAMTALLTVRAAWRRQLRLSHLLLVAGAVFLLSRGYRFRIEFPLLVLPLLAAQAPGWRTPLKPIFEALAGAAVLSLPLGSFISVVGPRPYYPMSYQRTMPGITAFLRKLDVGGKVLNDPNWGGFLAWELYPRYRIASDMQNPFLFNEEDAFMGNMAFLDPAAFAAWQGAYQPEFLAVPLSSDTFPRIASRYPRFKPIFFDDGGVLYADELKHPKLVEQYTLASLDPFALTGEMIEPLAPAQAKQWMPIVQRVASFDPRGGQLASTVLFAALAGKGDWEGALSQAENVVAGWPNQPQGYEMQAVALATLGRYQEAELALRRAIRLAGKGNPRLDVLLGRTLAKLGEWKESFEALQRGLDVYAGGASNADLELLSVAASKSGRHAEARHYLGIAVRRSGKAERARLEAIRASLPAH